MADIFIACAADDRPTAAGVAQALRQYGWSVYSQSDGSPGSSTAESVDEELRRCTCVLVLWSRVSAAEERVRAIAEVARHRRIIVTAMIEDVTPPLAFRHLACANLTTWRPDGNQGPISRGAWSEIVTRISDVLAQPGAPPAELTVTRTPPTPSRVSWSWTMATRVAAWMERHVVTRIGHTAASTWRAWSTRRFLIVAAVVFPTTIVGLNIPAAVRLIPAYLPLRTDWQRVATLPWTTDEGYVSAIALDSPSRAIAVGTMRSVWLSHDGGATWRPIVNGIPAKNNGELDVQQLAFAPAAGAPTGQHGDTSGSRRFVVLLTTGLGAFRLESGQAQWQDITPRAPLEQLTKFNMEVELVVDPRVPGTLYASFGGEVYRTVDGGREWTRVGGGVDGEAYTHLVGSPAAPDRLFALPFVPNNRRWLYATTDGGTTWINVPWRFRIAGLTKEPDDLDVDRLTIAAADPNTLYARMTVSVSGRRQRLIIRSNDGGRSWGGVDIGDDDSGRLGNVLIIDPLDANRLYAGGLAEVVELVGPERSRRRLRGGLGLSTVTAMAVDSGSRSIYVGTGQGLFRSTTETGR